MNHRPRGRAVVVGGGLAGIAAALALARARWSVVLCERRPFLGGRAFSFADLDTGAVVDNGQHVLVGACDRLRALLAAIDAPRRAFVRQRRLGLTIVDRQGRRAALRAMPLPPPFHLLPSILAYRHLDPPARRVSARAARALVASKGQHRSALDPLPLGAWLRGRGVSEQAIAALWEPLVRPALNVPAAEANVPLTAFLVEEAFWRGPRRGALWLPAVGLSDAIGSPAALALAKAGVEVRLGARVQRIAIEGSVARGIELSDGESLAAEAIVAALPPRALAELTGNDALPFDAAALGTSAIVNVYLWFDRPILDLAVAGTLDPDLQWVFDRTRLLGREAAGGHCVGVSLSAADETVRLPKDVVVERSDAALARLFPGRRAAERLRAAVVKEPAATFRAGAGLTGRRPPPDGARPKRLWLAGDWTDTGWPATMEGAVRSGEAAARAVTAR